MGAFLEKPKTDKHFESGSGANIRYGLASMQGWRVDMEDSHLSEIGLNESYMKDWSFFCVFDGHAGAKVAHYCARNLLETIKRTPEFEEVAKLLLNSSADGASGANPSSDERMFDLIRKGLRNGFLSLDEKMRSIPELHGDNERSGSTATGVLLSPSHYFFANLGDSRGLLCGNTSQLLFSTEDHKPFHPKERERIINAGGSVMIQRVNGSLAVSRALGDYEYKSVAGFGPCEQLVSPEPDITAIKRSKTDEFILLACDGIFDVMSNQELTDFIHARFKVHDSLPPVCSEILDACLSKGSRDNMSVILIALPAAPTVDPVEVKKEEALKRDIEERIKGILGLCDSMDDADGDYILRVLSSQDIPGIPPGAGLHALRSSIDKILEDLKGGSGSSSPEEAGGQSAPTPSKACTRM